MQNYESTDEQDLLSLPLVSSEEETETIEELNKDFLKKSPAEIALHWTNMPGAGKPKKPSQFKPAPDGK
jgi:hypothetical protein